MSFAVEQDAVRLPRHPRESSRQAGSEPNGQAVAARRFIGDGRPAIVNLGYWGDGAVTVREAQLAFVRRLADRLPELHGRPVLDASHCAGGPAAVLAVEYGAHVHAISTASEPVERALAYATQHGTADRLMFHAADPGALPFDEQSFEVVFSLEAAHRFSDKRRFVSEAFRVLSPGGMLALSDMTATMDVPVARRLPSRGVDLVTAEAWRKMAEEAGFEIVEHCLVGPAVYPGHRRWLMLSAAERRRAILDTLAPSEGVTGAAVRRLRAWWEEFLDNRSALSVTGALGLREYVLMLARRPAS